MTIHVLVLDDKQRRLDVYKTLYEKFGWSVTTVMHYKECVRLLESRRWDLVLLDHDIAEHVDDADFYLNEEGKKIYYGGSDVVQAILAMPVEDYPSEIIVHSQNNRKGNQMCEDLNRGGIPTVRIVFVDPDTVAVSTEESLVDALTWSDWFRYCLEG